MLIPYTHLLSAEHGDGSQMSWQILNSSIKIDNKIKSKERREFICIIELRNSIYVLFFNLLL